MPPYRDVVRPPSLKVAPQHSYAYPPLPQPYGLRASAGDPWHGTSPNPRTFRVRPLSGYPAASRCTIQPARGRPMPTPPPGCDRMDRAVGAALGWASWGMLKAGGRIAPGAPRGLYVSGGSDPAVHPIAPSSQPTHHPYHPVIPALNSHQGKRHRCATTPAWAAPAAPNQHRHRLLRLMALGLAEPGRRMVIRAPKGPRHDEGLPVSPGQTRYGEPVSEVGRVGLEPTTQGL